MSNSTRVTDAVFGDSERIPAGSESVATGAGIASQSMLAATMAKPTMTSRNLMRKMERMRAGKIPCSERLTSGNAGSRRIDFKIFTHDPNHGGDFSTSPSSQK
ncbi:hypothetical protein [Burkholderia multivorans]|uniref:hypothetical protein n=1 Tax=Burkholderia multivorans TaxID=87883 RepID=UPI0020B33A3F|nr:hypothetical protein [Burkholderia multivorans]